MTNLRCARAAIAAVAATIAGAAALGGAASASAALPDSLDPTFGAGGFAVNQNVSGSSLGFEGAALTAGGKIVAVTQSQVVSTADQIAVEYDSDGTLDPGFGAGGVFGIPRPGTGTEIFGHVAVQADGKILIAGTLETATQQGLEVIRLDADGSLDLTFGSLGRAFLQLGNEADAGPIVVEPDGKILVGATAFNEAAVVRFNADGTIDPTFGSGGYVTVPATDRVTGLTLTQFGGFAAAITENPTNHFVVARFAADGTLDPSFGDAGVARTAFPEGPALPTALIEQPDGKLVAAGIANFSNPIAKGWVAALARYGTDGSLDTSFGSNGEATFGLGADDASAYGLALDPSGGFFVAANFITLGNGQTAGLVHLTSDGQLDVGFGNHGVIKALLSQDPTVRTATTAGGLLVDPMGRVITYGGGENDSTDFAIFHPLLVRYAASDTTAPSIKCQPADSAWHTDDVQIACTAVDDSSGLANPAADASFTLSTHVATGTEDANAATSTRSVCDVAGNCATAGPIAGNKIDKAAPVVACGSADGAWHNTDVSIACTASDGGSGLASAGDAAFSLATNVAAGTFDASAATGSRSVCDAVGNCAPAGPIGGNRIDKQPPVAVCGTTDGAWHASNVSIACTASDGGSGLAAADAAFTLATSVPDGTEDAGASTSSRSVCDLAGNCVAAGPVGGNKIDRKPPAITVALPADGATYTVGQTLSSSFACSDGGSGYVSCSGPGSVATGTVGPQSFTVTAKDAVGNTSTKTVNYVVQYASGACNGGPGRTILQPINADGTSVFKRGSTVPAKFRVCDAAGTSVGTPGVVTAFRLVQTISSAAADVNEAVYSTTPDTAFRWDATDKQWIFNISTTSLTAGTTYVYRITLNDGSTIEFRFGLK